MEAPDGTEARAARALGWIVAAAALVVAAGTARAPFLDPDEARFARTTVEMLRSGDPVVPTYEGVPRLVKPPLWHWLQATAFRSFGVRPLTARLPSIVATLGSLALVAWVARRRFGNEGAAWAAAVFATSPLVVALGKVGTLDALLAVHVFAALALDMAEPDEAGRYRGAAIGALLGLAFLVKGPVGIVLPLLVMLAGRTAAGREVVPNLRAAAMTAAACAAVVLPWGLSFLERVGLHGTESTFEREVIDRYFEGTVHVRPPWFYGQVLAVGFLPWTAPLVLGLARVVGRRKSAAARTALYAAAGLLIAVLFLSLGKGKLPSYLLPLAPLVALLVTWELGKEIEESRETMLGPLLLTFSLAATSLGLGVVAAAPRLADLRAPATLGAAAYALALVFAAWGLLARSPRRVYASAAGAAGVVLLVAGFTVFPTLARERSCSEIASAPELLTERPIVRVGGRAPSLTLYLDRIPETVDVYHLAERIARPDRPLFVVAERDRPALAQWGGGGLRTVRHAGGWWILEEAAPVEDAAPAGEAEAKASPPAP